MKKPVDAKQLEIADTLSPLYGQVVIIRDQSDDQVSKGGILLKTGDAPSYVAGRVVAVGPGRILPDGSLMELAVKPGDYVRYRENFGDTFSIEGYEYHALQETDVICKLPEPNVQ